MDNESEKGFFEQFRILSEHVKDAGMVSTLEIYAPILRAYDEGTWQDQSSSQKLAKLRLVTATRVSGDTVYTLLERGDINKEFVRAYMAADREYNQYLRHGGDAR